jgi:hypothetical protein
MRRPKPIVSFERLIWTAFIVGAIGPFVDIHNAIPEETDWDRGLSSLIIMWTFSLTVTAGFWFAISRLGSNIARWLYTLLLALPLIFTVAILHTLWPNPGSGRWISAISTALYLFSALVLFHPDADRWLRGEREPDPTVFE